MPATPTIMGVRCTFSSQSGACQSRYDEPVRSRQQQREQRRLPLRREAAWENTAEETGFLYYTLRLNDPSFDQPIYSKLFQDKTDGGVLHIVFD